MSHVHVSKDISALREMICVVLASGEAARLMHRLDCVLLVAEGRSTHEVAQWLGVGERSVQRWIRAAGTSGIEGLLEHHCGGRPPALTPAQMQTIKRDLQATPGDFGYPDRRWTGKRLALHLDRCHAIGMSVRHCQRIIADSSSGALAPR